MLKRIRTYLFEKETKRRLAVLPSRKVQFKKNQPNHYGILLDASQVEHRSIVLNLAEDLRKSGNRVKILGYIDGKSETISLPFDIVSSQERSKMSGVPRSEKVDAFIEQPFDILINTSLHYNHKALEFIATVSKAAFRIGPWYQHGDAVSGSRSGQPNPYDLCVDTGSNTSLKSWISELMHTLDKIY
jgi:hypothetical protein